MKLARRPSHVVFDLDGVLLDTEPLYTRATQEIVGALGAVFDWSVKRGMMGRGDVEGARYLVRTLGLPITAEQYLARQQPLLDQLFASTPAMSGARSFVEALATRGLPSAVATSSARRQYELKIKSHDWFHLFEVVVCGDDPRIGALKPAPDIFLAAAEDLRAAPSDCVVLEDSLAGVDAALAAGMQVIALPDAALDPDRFRHANLVVRSFSELDVAMLG